MKLANKIKLGFLSVVVIFVVSLIPKTLSVVTLEGNEVAVLQDIMPGGRGVLDEIWTSGTKWYCGWLMEIHVYDTGIQKITFDDQAANREAEYPRIQVEVGANGGQRAYIALSANYRLIPSKVVDLHKQGIGKTYESVLLKREIVDIINEIARPYPTALDIYSGAGFVEFKNRVEKALRENTVLKNSGIDIENTIIYGVHLDPAYEAEIAGKQIATQQKLRKVEEVKAAEEEARRIFALAEARVAEAKQLAESKKITVVKEAEAQAAEVVLRATAKRDADLVEASGIIAKGEAQARVAALQRESLYAGESGAWRAKVEIATAQAEKLKNLLSGVSVIPDRAIIQIGKSSLAIEQDSNSK